MSTIEITSTPANVRPSSATRPSRVNDVLAYALIALLVLSPLPFGSARPFFWGASAAYLGIVVVIYATTQIILGARLRVTFGMLRLPAILSALLVSFLVFQTLPIGDWLGPWPIESFAGTPLTSRTVSVSPNMTVLMLLRQLAYAVFFFLMLQVTANRARREIILIVLLWIIILYGVYGIVSLQMGDTILGLPKWAYEGSATGPFVNRNSFATFLAFGAVLALSMFVVEIHKFAYPDTAGRPLMSNLLLNGGALAVLIVFVVATNSRMGLVVTLAGMLAVLVCAAINGMDRRALLVLLVTATGAALAAPLYLGSNMVDRLGDAVDDTVSRANLYVQVWEMITSRPFFGFGGGSFELAYPLFHRPPVGVDYVWNSAHSTYLSLWSDLGLVFGSIPIIILAYFAWRVVAALVANSGTAQAGGDWLVQTTTIGIFTVSAIHSLVDFSLEIQANTFMFLALIACGISSTIRMRRSARGKWQ